MNPLAFYLFAIEGLALGSLLAYFPLSLLILLSLQAVFLYRVWGIKRSFPLFLLLIVCILYSYCRLLDRDAKEPLFSEVSFVATVADLPKKTERGWIQEVYLRGASSAGIFLHTPLPPGTVLKGTGRIVPLHKRYNPGAITPRYDLLLIPERFYLSEQKDLRWLPMRLRWNLFRYFQKNFRSDVAELMSAIVIGHTTGGDLRMTYGRAGIAHLLSISGTHFGILGLMVFYLNRWMLGLLDLRRLYRLSSYLNLKVTSMLLSFPLLIFYLLLSGARIPAIRSFIMVVVFVFSLLLGRRGQWLYGVLFAAMVILFIEPGTLWEVSFQMSFLAVLSIGFALQMGEVLLKGFKNRFITIPLRTVIICTGAFVGLLPVISYLFHYIPLLSIPMNLIVTPLVCMFLLPLALLGSLCYLATGLFPFGSLLNWGCGVLNWTVQQLADNPLIWVPVKGFPAATLLSFYLIPLGVLLNRRWVIIGSISIFLLTLVPSLIPERLPRVTFLDVGQGDAAVVEDSDTTIVIDTGHSGVEVSGYLRHEGIREVDALVISHAGRDHSGGFWRLLDDFKIGEVWHNGLLRFYPPLRGVAERGLKAGSVLEKGDLRVTVLHPSSGYYSLKGDEENNQSLVFLLGVGPLTTLFTGDIESDAEEAILRLPVDIRSRVLKVAHHGSLTSSREEFIKTVAPEIAVISAGRGNPYGHPNPLVLQRLRGTKLYRTDRDGAVRVSLMGDDLVVQRYKDMIMRPVRPFDVIEEVKNIRRLFMVW